MIRKEIPSDPARMAALKSGQVDLVNYVPATDYAAMQKDKSVDTFVADSVYFLNLTPNVKEPCRRRSRSTARRSTPTAARPKCARPWISPSTARRSFASCSKAWAVRPLADARPISSAATRTCRSAPTILGEGQLLADAGYPKGFEIDFHCTTTACRAMRQCARRSRRCGLAPA